jgi:aminocarboxymuconate-semialdehyde decarboxylase
MAAIDAHAHVIVPELLRSAAPDEPWRPRVEAAEGRQVIEFEGRRIDSIVSEIVSIDGILSAQAATGIDRTILSPWVPLLFCEIEAQEALERCRIQNRGLARIAAVDRRRVSVLGAVPLQDPGLAAVELEAIMATGVFAGVEVPASVGGSYLGDQRLEPFCEAAAHTRALVFVHPTTRGFADPAFSELYLWNLVGNPMETTITAAQLVLSGTLERHPDLIVLLAHGGGAIVALGGRLRRGQAAVAASAARLREPVTASLARLRVDTVVHDSALVRALVQLIGADRVLLGSDRPFDMGDPDPVATVRRASLDCESEELILSGNARRLLDGAEHACGGANDD